MAIFAKFVVSAVLLIAALRLFYEGMTGRPEPNMTVRVVWIILGIVALVTIPLILFGF